MHELLAPLKAGRSAQVNRFNRPIKTNREAVPALFAGPIHPRRSAPHLAGCSEIVGLAAWVIDHRDHAEDDRQPHYSSAAHTSELQSLMRTTYALFCLKTQ